MKRVLLTLVALVAAIAGLNAAVTPTHVRVTPKAGDAVVVSFDSQPEIVFLGDGIKLTSTEDDPVTFQFDEIAAIDFTASTEVEAMAEDTLKMRAYPDRIEFVNVPEGSGVRVYSLAGQMVRELPGSGTVTLYKADFNKGIYIVNINNNSFKLTF